MEEAVANMVAAVEGVLAEEVEVAEVEAVEGVVEEEAEGMVNMSGKGSKTKLRR